jgi:superfamily I DNA/RNA helicase
MKPTAQQSAFLKTLTTTVSNIALVARAGCGKTSTILMGVDAIRKAFPMLSVLVCAFNKAIAEEVGEKLKAAGHRDWKMVQSSTLHALGFGLLKFMFNPRIDDKKVGNIVDSMNDPVFIEYRAQIISLVKYAKGAGFGFFGDKAISNTAAWCELADHFDVNGFEDTSDIDAVVTAAQAVYKKSLMQTDVIDFDDMILMPLVRNLVVKFPKDIVFLDEAQDLSPSRQALARKFVRPHTGRMIVVGDDRQAIYGFSGADAQALPNLIASLNAVVLPLSVTWRCPKAVVAQAQKYVPDIMAAETAPEGSVTALPKFPDDMKAGDAILCRNTAPLISTAYGLIRQGHACKVEGRSIGEGLITLVKRWKVKTVDALLQKLAIYQAREVQKAQAKGNDAKIEEVEDRVGTCVEICNACIASGKTALSDVVEFIENLFADGAENCITLATYHRSKGREWTRVFLFEHNDRCPSKSAKKPWQFEQEENLAYVAFTRAKSELVFVR